VLLAAGRNAVARIVIGSPVGPIFAGLLLGGLVYNLTEASFNNDSIIGFSIWLVAVHSFCSDQVSDTASEEASEHTESGRHVETLDNPVPLRSSSA